MKIHGLWWTAVAVAGAMAGCATTPQMSLTPCEDPRPQICTREYMPVCGHKAADDSWQTYGNACEACADSSVEGWRPGACEE